MLKNYFKIAIRSLIKNKVYSFINLAGLSIGLACVLVIVSYVNLELGYDKFHTSHQDIYRITEYRTRNNQEAHSAMTFSPLADLLETQIPAVKKVVKMYPLSGLVSTDKINKFKETSFTLVDSVFFDVFTLKLLKGTLEGALDNPFSLVIPENKALEYFGTTEVIGKELFFENASDRYSFNITAVIEDFPQNSHFEPDFLASFSSINIIQPRYNNWFHPSIYLYVQLQAGFTGRDLDEQMVVMGEEHYSDNIKETRHHEAQSISDIHLNSNLANEWQANSSKAYVKLFTVIALFILLIACINFMNLATAQAGKRAKEVGLRKVMGAEKSQLLGQFLGESFIVTFLSYLIAFGLAQLALNYFFNELIGKEISVVELLSGTNLLWILTSLLLVSLLAGSYPAFYLSAFKPITTLKGKVIKISGLGNVRKFMVTFQFFISCLLIIGTLIVLQQINFLRNEQLGFDKEQIVAIGLVDRQDQNNYLALKDALMSESSIVNVAASSTLPGHDGFFSFPIIIEDSDDDELTIKTLGIDQDFIGTYNLEVTAGRDFNKDITTDVNQAFILNEAAVAKFGWDDALNKDFTLTVHTSKGMEKRVGKVIGVVKDFHYQSLYNLIDPLVIYVNTGQFYTNFLNVKFAPGNWQEAISMLTTKWQAFSPNKPIEYYFLDDELAKFYDSEVKIGRIFTVFAGLSIIISCLGLLGLSAFSAQQRVKEIGIRKVLGANVSSILLLLFREYIVLIVLANLIAWPLGWYLSSEWLSTFPYRTSLTMSVFLLTFIGALIIALLTVSFQSMKAAVANPVKSLQDE
jgi:putative ABC transport system permease protein